MSHDQEENDSSRVLIEAKKCKQKRKINPEYKNIKTFFLNPKISPSEIKLNTINKSTLGKNIRSVKISNSLNSIIKSKLNKKFDKNNGEEKIKVHQLVPILAPRDAVGNEVMAIRTILRNQGYSSEIFVERVHPEMSHESKNFFSYKDKFEADILIYHHATSSKLVDAILGTSAKLVLIYHNLTPEKYFKGINERAVESLKQARNQLKILKDRATIAIGHSDFSSQELHAAGFSNVLTLPFLIDFSSYDVKPLENLISKFKNSVNILFVGRFVPHKKIENLLQIFAYYKTCINNNSNLFLIGNYSGTEKYYQWLRYLVSKSGLQNVHFVTKADHRSLVTYYKLADVYLSMSEHEGFGVPLVESMYLGVPVIAFKSSAVPSTLGGAGILVGTEKVEDIGEVIDLVANDNTLREKIIHKQKERVNAFDLSKTGSEILSQIKILLGNEKVSSL